MLNILLKRKKSCCTAKCHGIELFKANGGDVL